MVAAAEVVGFEDSAMAAASVAFIAGGAGVGDEKKSHINPGSKCCCAGSKETKEQQKKTTYELVDYDSLPEYLKHNEFILGYYRSNWPWKETLLSVFSVHNETINVWTHLIGFFVFLALTFGTASVAMAPAQRLPALTGEPTQFLMAGKSNISELIMHSGGGSNMDDKANASSAMPAAASGSGWYLPSEEYSHVDDYRFSKKFSSQANETKAARHIKTTSLVFSADANTSRNGNIIRSSNTSAQLEPITRWPFMAFLCGAMLCLLTSSLCHLLCCHSEKCSYIMLRLDYAGISALIVTSFYPLVYYTFLCHPFYLRLYLSAITLSGLAAALVSLIPVFDSPSYRYVRATLFFCMGASGLVPIFHKLILYGAAGRPEVLVATAYEMLMGLLYGAGVVVYATRVPERWMPGKFDLAGHSHQLFHVLVVAGAYVHYLAGLVYLQWRDTDRCCGMM